MDHSNNPIFPAKIYSQFLTTINSTKFSKREIDVLACVLNGRSAKGIASFLSISPKTAEAHTYNVMKKLDCTSREGVISLMETSGKFLSLKEYYVSLLRQTTFEKALKEIASLRSEEEKTCLIVTGQAEEHKSSLLYTIKDHLNLAGIKALIETTESVLPSDIFVNNATDHYTLYALPVRWRSIKTKESFKLAESAENALNVLFLCFEKRQKEEVPQELGGIVCVDFSQSKNYYFVFFDTLRKLLPRTNLDSIIEGFKQQCEFSRDPLENRSFQKEIEKLPTFSFLTREFLEQRKWHGLLVFIIVICAIGVGFLVPKEEKDLKLAYSNTNPSESPIRSDLVLPNASTLLNRPDLIEEINDKYKKQGNGIQSVALVGIGGAGKTTLAREYARSQKDAVIWEMSAETYTSLMESFESLAYRLAKSAADKVTIQDLTEIKKPSEREKKIIEFVKDHLRQHPSWLLIYDNVEKFSDLHKYYPLNSETWGKGRVLITTRDGTIQNNKQIDHTIFIGELDKVQKLSLFTQIIGNEENHQLTPAQLNERISFLEKIPPFPLDVSVAACYLNATNAPYANYLENLNKVDENFTTVQENLLKEAGEYTQTRHGIITLSLEQIMNIHKDFTDLLLFISLLDSQHIPRDLLTKYKNDTIVDSFVYQLKKYSLISDGSSSPLGATFSMHRNTQDISFFYLEEFLKLGQSNSLLKTIVYTLDDYLDQAIEQEDFARMQVMAHHLEKVLNRHGLLTDFFKGLLESKLGIIYYFTNIGKSHKLLNNSLKKLALAKSSSENNSRLARSLLHIGAVYTELRLDEEAQAALERATHIYSLQEPKNDTDLSWALSHLGNIHRKLGNYKKAKNYFEESIDLYKKSGSNTKRIARTLAYLGSVYRGLGLYKKSIDTLNESLDLYKKGYSNDHFRVGWILVQLGNVYRDLGDFEKAKGHLENGLLIFQKHLPDNHVSIGLAFAYLGNCCRELGEYDKSLSYLQKSLKIHQKHFGENHVKMGWLLFHLANTYKALGHHQETQKLSDNVLKIYANFSGEDNIEKARLLRTMAEVYLEKNLLNEAENSIAKSLRILQPHNHLEFSRSLETLGEILMKKSTCVKDSHESQTLKNQALGTFNEALKIAEQHLPSNSSHIQKIHDRVKLIKE